MSRIYALTLVDSDGLRHIIPEWDAPAYCGAMGAQEPPASHRHDRLCVRCLQRYMRGVLAFSRTPISINTRVRVIRRASVFFGHIGVVVERPQRPRQSSSTHAVRFPDHPWQAKNPAACWFFDDNELVATTTTADRTPEQEMP